MIININKDHYLYNTGYFTNDSSAYCYVPIYKNAHSFGMYYFEKFLKYKAVEMLPQNKQFIVFLRNPVERWMSAVAEYFNWHVNLKGKLQSEKIVDTDIFTNKKRKPYIIPDELLHLVFSAVRLDVHGDLQIKSLLGLNTDRCVFFNIDDPNFVLKLNTFVFRKMKTKEPYVYSLENEFPVSIVNANANNSFKKQIVEQLRTVIQNNSSYRTMIYHYYNPDFQLIKSIKYY